MSVSTSSGKDYGLSGTQLQQGQTIRARERMTLTMASGDRLTLSQNTVLRLVECGDRAYTGPPLWEVVLGTIWSKLSHITGNDEPQYQTDWGMTGPRGTAFELSYNRSGKLTTVQVSSGRVTRRNRYGKRRRTITLRAHQTETQQGKNPPRLVRR